MPPEAVSDAAGTWLATRLRAPVARATMLKREALLERLDQARDQRVIRICAPAGFGKTELLAQWCAHRVALGDRVGWVSADDEDLSPGKLVDCFARSLAIAGADIASAESDARHSDSLEARQRLRCLINGIARDIGRLILVIDDIDRLAAEELRDLAGLLLRWAPDNLLVVLSGRGLVEIGISTFAVQGLVMRLGDEDLKFDLYEVLSMFGGSLDRQAAAALLERCQGWPAMIGLARGLLMEREEGAGLGDQNGPLVSLSVEYLSQEVLGQLRPAEYQALLALSLLDMIDDAAAAALCGDAAECWRALLRRQDFRPFVSQLSETDPAWRLHPILRSALRSAFERAPSDQRRSWHLRAAAWHHRNGQLVLSVHHAVQAADPERAAAYVFAAGSTRIWIRHGRTQLEAIDGAIDDATREAFPRLKLLRALSLLKQGRLADAEGMYLEARAALGPIEALEDDVRFDVQLLESTLRFNQCKPSGDAYLQLYADRMQRFDGSDDYVLGNVRTLMGLSLEQRGRPAEALDVVADAQIHYARANLPHGSFYVELHRAFAWFATGDCAAADVALDRACALARRYFANDAEKQLPVTILRAEIAADMGRFEVAERMLGKVPRRLGQAEAWYSLHASAHGTLIGLALSRGDDDEAERLLASLQVEAVARGVTGLLPFVAAHRMSVLARTGDWQGASRIAAAEGIVAADYVATPVDGMLWREREAVLRAFCDIALARGDAGAVPALVETPLADFRRAGLCRPQIELHLAAALAADRLGHCDQADDHLVAAMTLSQRSGHVRCSLARAAVLAPMLEGLCERRPDIQAESLVATLRHAAKPGPGTPDLTPREADVLLALGQGLSAKRIARSLTLTENTVKFHLKNIYGKLGVHNRSAAIEYVAAAQPRANSLS